MVCNRLTPGVSHFAKVRYPADVGCCPTCGRSCHRVLSTFTTITNEKAMLSPRNLERNGSTLYKRAGDGYYEKTFGKGPRVIKST